MQLKERYHPYPVLAPYTNDYLNSEFRIESLEDKTMGKKYLFEIELNIKNPGLENLIKENKAEYVIHVECSKTSFREVFTSDLSKLEIRIDSSNLDGKVEFSPFIIAKENILNYKDGSFDPIFDGFSFNINKGQYLAIGNRAIISIIKDKDDLKQLSSIIRIAQVADLEKETKVNLEGDRIQIMVSNETYEMYTYASRNHNRLRILHSMIVLPALIYVLYELKEDSGNDFEQYSDRRWFQALEVRMKELGLNLDSNLFSLKSPYELAQILLDYPTKDALNKIYEADQEEN